MMTKAAPSILIGALLLIMGCVLSGRPQVFSDTRAYYALGQEVAAVFIAPAAAPDVVTNTATLRGRVMAPSEAAATMRLAYTVAGSRSPYWSVLLYALIAIGTAWAVVGANALAAAATIHVAMRGFGIERGYLGVIAALACVSTLPLFVLFLMPDVFTGLAILAAAVLIARWAALSRAARAGLWAMLAAAALFHTSHIPLLGGLAILGLGWGWQRRDAAMRLGAWATLAAAAIGLLGALAYPMAVRVMRGERIYAPPFVAARMIADGPGRDLLARDCRRGDVWGWCRFAGQPMVDVNQMLWATDARRRVFQAADYTTRVRIIGEQPRFVLATIAHDPLGVAAAAMRKVAGQLVQFGSFEVLDDPTWRYRDPSFAVFADIVPGADACRDGRSSCGSRIDIGLYDAVLGAVMLGSLAAIAWLFVRRPALRRRWLVAIGILAAGYVANAAICGVLSGVSERYQARVAWLIPAVALFLFVDRRRVDAASANHAGVPG